DRVDRFGKLGDPEPSMAGVKDALNDQGGHVRASWLPSYLDSDPIYGVLDYVLYRQAPAHAALAALRAGRATAVGEDDARRRADAGRARYLVVHDHAQTSYWEQIAEIPAQTLAGYSYVAPTTGDSVAGSNPYTLFMIEALGNGGGHWFSAADSGYSVDNLPPVAPAPFAGNFVAGSGALLTWGPNGESALAGYRLFNGITPG